MNLTQSDKSTIESQEEELWTQRTRFDVKRVRELLAEDFREFGKSGRCYGLDDTLAIEERSFSTVIPLPNFNAEAISENVVLATYNSEVTYGETTSYARRSSIWSKRNGTWVLRFHQGTPYDPDA